ncbi:hypothetical protein QJS10_CPB14g01534 [Acorus calamus]|uniref:Uncharacterized protein n=1 Tax=Acorus calamus TaxID=4465 RepID=A0AAV9DDX1_ACOCL|nr:hypothetical protein QJS10_CPB14g01534 [Acorus calamus]
MEIQSGHSKEPTEIENFEGVEETNGDDEGYHTPTSPKNIIQKLLHCPPPPKKKKKATWRRRFKKRRSDVVRVAVVGDLGLIFRRRCNRTVEMALGNV